MAALAITAALLARARTGTGGYLDISTTDGVLSLMSLFIDEYLATGVETGPRSALLTGRFACYDVYPARDGKWLAVGAIEPQFFANLCRALGCDEHIPNQMDDARQDEIRAAFRVAFAGRDRDAWVAELATRDTCVAPVLSISEVARDPHLASRGVFAEAEHRERGRFPILAPVVAGADRIRAPYPGRPPSESDADELLRAAGLDAGEVEALKEKGVVG
jgi:alpha-methylacyl-CoA racemase